MANQTRSTLLLRVGLGVLFLTAGLAKLFALDVTTSIVAEKGIPLASAVAVVVGLAEGFAGLVLVAGARTRAVARALMIGVVFAALIFHDPLGLPPGVAYATAVSLTVDGLVLLGLAMLARSDDEEPAPAT